MDPSISTAQGARGLRNAYGEGGRSGSSGPRAGFDDAVPAGTDPEGRWRISNSDRYRHIGTTTAQRAGANGYKPGYGVPSNRNTGSVGNLSGGLTPRAQWDAQFQQQLTPAAQADHVDHLWPASSGGATSPENPGLGEPRPQPTIPVLPTGAAPAPAPQGQLMADTGRHQPQSASVIPSGTSHPIVQAGGETPGSTAVRQAIGLPPGQTASSTFIPYQNDNPYQLSRSSAPDSFAPRGQAAPKQPIKSLSRAPTDPLAL